MCFCLAWHIPSKPSVFHVLVKGSLLRSRRKKKEKASPSAPISPGWPEERPVSHTPGVPGKPPGRPEPLLSRPDARLCQQMPSAFHGNTPLRAWRALQGMKGAQWVAFQVLRLVKHLPSSELQFSLPDTPSSHRWLPNSVRTWPRRHRAAFPRRLLCSKGVPITSIRALFLLGQWLSMGIITFSSYLFSHLSFIWPAIGKLLYPIQCPFL